MLLLRKVERMFEENENRIEAISRGRLQDLKVPLSNYQRMRPNCSRTKLFQVSSIIPTSLQTQRIYLERLSSSIVSTNLKLWRRSKAKNILIRLKRLKMTLIVDPKNTASLYRSWRR
jgi:hypothetical protein